MKQWRPTEATSSHKLHPTTTCLPTVPTPNLVRIPQTLSMGHVNARPQNAWCLQMILPLLNLKRQGYQRQKNQSQKGLPLHLWSPQWSWKSLVCFNGKSVCTLHTCCCQWPPWKQIPRTWWLPDHQLPVCRGTSTPWKLSTKILIPSMFPIWAGPELNLVMRVMWLLVGRDRQRLHL